MKDHFLKMARRNELLNEIEDIQSYPPGLGEHTWENFTVEVNRIRDEIESIDRDLVKAHATVQKNIDNIFKKKQQLNNFYKHLLEQKKSGADVENELYTVIKQMSMYRDESYDIIELAQNKGIEVMMLD